MSGKYEDWPELYAHRLMSAGEAASLVRPNDSIVIPVGSLTSTIAAAIFQRGNALSGVKVYDSAPMYDPGWFQSSQSVFALHVEIFSTVVSREALAQGWADFTSVPFSQRFKVEDERGGRVHHGDVALISVSSPDHLGFCSLGLSVWNTLSFVRRARIVLAEVQSGHPRAGGDSRIHVSEIDAFVEASTLPASLAGTPLEDYPQQIADFVAAIVKDGDTIQVGTGSLTNGLPRAGAFDDKRDLGVHAELSVPGMTGLVRRGIITGARKTLHEGKYVAAQLEASQSGDLEFIQDNPMFALFDVGYVNHIPTIAMNDNLVAINNALAIDFAGQITAESIGTQLWSGPGGQQDFAIGAVLSKGGRNVTVLKSTAANGQVSRIMPRLPEGAIVTVPRQYADFVVTEWGVAQLFGKSDVERAQELIAVADPIHRPALRIALKKE